MRYVVEADLKDFDFWAGAIEAAKAINELDNADECWAYLEDELTIWNEDGYTPTETAINDLIWFDALDMLRNAELIPDEEN